jgi:hypothetical protein
VPHRAARTAALEPAPSHPSLLPPLQVVFGIVGGLLAGIILGCTRWFNSRYKRLVGLYGAALLLMYFLEYYNLLSGGWVGAGVQGAGCGDEMGGWRRRSASMPARQLCGA